MCSEGFLGQLAVPTILADVKGLDTLNLDRIAHTRIARANRARQEFLKLSFLLDFTRFRMKSKASCFGFRYGTGC